jgi:hypothetical protein
MYPIRARSARDEVLIQARATGSDDWLAVVR